MLANAVPPMKPKPRTAGRPAQQRASVAPREAGAEPATSAETARAPRRARDEPRVSPEEFDRLAAFRMLLRQFQSFSEQASGLFGLTSVQYQALLAIQSQHDGPPMTVKLLAQQLIIKHNSAVGLVDRIEHLGLVARQPSATDRRSVVVVLTPRGRHAMNRIAIEHRAELRRIAPELARHMRHFAK